MFYCDLNCKYARWPDKLADGSKTCRTFIALHCDKIGRLVDKNGLCKVNPVKGPDADPPEKDSVR